MKVLSAVIVISTFSFCASPAWARPRNEEPKVEKHSAGESGGARHPVVPEKKPETVEEILKAMEHKVQEVMRRGIDDSHGGEGLLERTDRLAKALKVGGVNLNEKVAALEKALGIKEDKDLGLLARIDNLEKHYREDKLADEFEKVYGVPGKMKPEERLAKLEAFFDKRAADGRTARRSSGDDVRMKMLKEEFPDVTSNLGTVNRSVAAFEKAFDLSAGSKSISERIEAIEAIAEKKIVNKIQSTRKSQTVEERAATLYKNAQ